MGSKHEARASLLSEQSSIDRTFPSYPPADFHYAGGYHQREGFATATTPPTPTKTSWSYLPNSRWTWAFMLIVLIQGIVCLGLEIFVFVKFEIDLNDNQDNNSSDDGQDPPPNENKTVPVYLALFIFGFLYQLLLTWDALRLKNTIQVIGLCIYNVGLLVEAAVQIDQITDAVKVLQTPEAGQQPGIGNGFLSPVHPLIIVVPCVLGLGLVLMCFVAWKLYQEFAWSIYKHISADLRLKRRFLSYQIYITLLKFDFFFFLCFTVQFLIVVEAENTAEKALTIAALPVTVIILILAAYWTRKENLIGMLVIMVLWFAALAYFLFKLIRMYDGPTDRVRAYQPARTSLTTFAVITVILLIVTIIYAIICTFNFGKGLKPHLQHKRGRTRAGSSDMDKLYTNSVPLAGPGPSRMTID